MDRASKVGAADEKGMFTVQGEAGKSRGVPGGLQI